MNRKMVACSVAQQQLLLFRTPAHGINRFAYVSLLFLFTFGLITFAVFFLFTLFFPRKHRCVVI